MSKPIFRLLLGLTDPLVCIAFLVGSILAARSVRRWVATCLVTGSAVAALASVTAMVLATQTSGETVNVTLLILSSLARTSGGIGWMILVAGFLGFALGVRNRREVLDLPPGQAPTSPVGDRFTTASYVLAGVSLAVVAITLPLFGAGLMLRAAPHGDKGLASWELVLALVLGLVPVLSGVPAILLSRRSGTPTKGASRLALVAVAIAGLELCVPIVVAVAWGAAL